MSMLTDSMCFLHPSLSVSSAGPSTWGMTSLSLSNASIIDTKSLLEAVEVTETVSVLDHITVSISLLVAPASPCCFFS